MNGEVEQAIRRSHCARTGHEHECVGSCTIARDKVTLACVLCGTGEYDPFLNPERGYIPQEAIQVAQRFARALGLDWDSLASATKAKAALVADELNGRPS